MQNAEKQTTSSENDILLDNYRLLQLELSQTVDNYGVGTRGSTCLRLSNSHYVQTNKYNSLKLHLNL